MSLTAGDERRLTARAYDAKNRTTSASFAWSSANAAIATVGEINGIVTAVAAGSTTVTATAGTLSATATVTVRPPSPPVTVSTSVSDLTLVAGEVEHLTAIAFDSVRRPTSASFVWSSSDPAVATVGTIDGIVTAISPGATTVTATTGALRATVSVLVLPTAISVSGTFAFTRTTWSGQGPISDVLTFSGADRTLRSHARPAQFGSIAAPAWSPDGTLLAVEVMHAYYPDDYGDYTSDLYVLDAASSADASWRALTSNSLSRSPSWSPDGKRIAYLKQEALYYYSNDIYVIDAAGGEPVRVTRTTGEYGTPRWSPDGTRLAFSSADGENSEIFIVNADGSGLTNVTRNSAWDAEPSWSPDGATLAFVSNRDGLPGNVFVVDAGGRNVRRLTSLRGSCWGPAWSPDGEQIIFFSQAGLLVMNADGSSLARLLKPPPSSNVLDAAPVWRR